MSLQRRGNSASDFLQTQGAKSPFPWFSSLLACFAYFGPAKPRNCVSQFLKICLSLPFPLPFSPSSSVFLENPDYTNSIHGWAMKINSDFFCPTPFSQKEQLSYLVVDVARFSIYSSLTQPRSWLSTSPETGSCLTVSSRSHLPEVPSNSGATSQTNCAVA